MLKITKAHIAKADALARKNFYQRLRDHVREKQPEATASWPDSKLMAYIAEQDKIAGEHGVTTERGIALWVLHGLEVGKDFYQQPEFKDYIGYPGEPDANTRFEIYTDYFAAVKKHPGAKPEAILNSHGYPVGEK